MAVLVSQDQRFDLSRSGYDDRCGFLDCEPSLLVIWTSMPTIPSRRREGLRRLVALPVVHLQPLGNRTYKLASSTTSEYGRYVKSVGEPVTGSPTLVEADPTGFLANTSGVICFWGYTVTAEIPGPRLIPMGQVVAPLAAVVMTLSALALARRKKRTGAS